MFYLEFRRSVETRSGLSSLSLGLQRRVVPGFSYPTSCQLFATLSHSHPPRSYVRGSLRIESSIMVRRRHYSPAGLLPLILLSSLSRLDFYDVILYLHTNVCRASCRIRPITAGGPPVTFTVTVRAEVPLLCVGVVLSMCGTDTIRRPWSELLRGSPFRQHHHFMPGRSYLFSLYRTSRQYAMHRPTMSRCSFEGVRSRSRHCPEVYISCRNNGQFIALPPFRSTSLVQRPLVGSRRFHPGHNGPPSDLSPPPSITRTLLS
ncbi:hypothetical protein OF83DRAFT_826431 [Amylostereum chailletii]|nr:hypothetical protein OF83DRAFT_826431 [Amylostereum chailletii]